jgi:uncharacterized protein
MGCCATMLRQRWHWPLYSSVVTLAVVFTAANLQAAEAKLNDELLLQSGYGNANEVASLLKQGADPNAGREGGRTALHLAADDGHLDVMQLLIDAGADVNAEDDSGRTVLGDAASSRDGKAVKLLLNAGATPNAGALALAAWLGHADSVQALLDAGVSPQPGLGSAAQGGHVDLVRTLLEEGASANVSS